MNNIYIPKPYKILNITQITKIEWLFKVEFDRVDEVNFGQFIQISLPKVGEAPISITEFNVEEGWIEFLIRKVGKVTDVLFELKPGDNMFLRGPYGNGFPFDEKYKDKHLVVVAGGSGCGPVRSMINAVHREFKTVKKMDMVVGFKDSECILFRDEIEEWNVTHNAVVTLDNIYEDEGENKELSLELQEGLVTQHLHMLDLSDMEDVEVVIVGPPMMMKFTAMEFEKMGVPEEQIWLSFERKMSCAVGKCGHCKVDETYICLEGPVFNYKKGKTLID